MWLLHNKIVGNKGVLRKKMQSLSIVKRSCTDKGMVDVPLKKESTSKSSRPIHVEFKMAATTGTISLWDARGIFFHLNVREPPSGYARVPIRVVGAESNPAQLYDKP
jgi:hypothetical protein